MIIHQSDFQQRLLMHYWFLIVAMIFITAKSIISSPVMFSKVQTSSETRQSSNDSVNFQWNQSLILLKLAKFSPRLLFIQTICCRNNEDAALDGRLDVEENEYDNNSEEDINTVHSVDVEDRQLLATRLNLMISPFTFLKDLCQAHFKLKRNWRGFC